MHVNTQKMKNLLLVLGSFLIINSMSAEVDTTLNTVVIDTTVSICEGEAFWGYTVTGMYSDTLTTDTLCTFRTLDLTVVPKIPDTYTRESLCEGTTYTWPDGTVIDTSGTYVLVDSSGPCIVQHILEITILPRNDGETTIAEICGGDSYEWGGQIYNQSGTYVEAALGPCDGDNTLLLTVLPWDDCVELQVLVFEDLNNNCLYDVGEPGMENIGVAIDSNILKSTDDSGRALAFPRVGVHTISAQLNPSIYTSCNNDQTVDLQAGMSTVYIPVEVLVSCTDVSLGASVPFLRRCFENRLHIEGLNAGSSLAEDVLLHVTMDPFFIEIDSEMELIAIEDSIYTYLLGDIPPRKKVQKSISFTLSCDADLGTAHYLSASLEYDNKCSVLSDTSLYFECRENIGAYDPNDKSSYIDGIADAEVINEDSELEYLIRFQNTGTDTAFTVRIEDDLSDLFDISTMTPVAASHSYEWGIEEGRNLEIVFNDIRLVDSTANEEDSHGFIKFKVELTDDRPDAGDLVTNTAAIYFDFNDPIVTNTVENYYLCKHDMSTIAVTICEGEEYEGYSVEGSYEDLFMTDLGCDSLRRLELTVLPISNPACAPSDVNEIAARDVILYPMPATSQVHIQNNGSIQFSSFDIINIHGISILEGSLNSNTIQTSELSGGVYIVRLQADDLRIDKRIVIVN